ncbi:MAG: efflux RND transporter periplasmic adaptor subunit [Gemmatimonadetes bacterium]|nr:efflux RND transporter periplasmic adaptor subunit [Gemmatimonadota bacterium]
MIRNEKKPRYLIAGRGLFALPLAALAACSPGDGGNPQAGSEGGTEGMEGMQMERQAQEMEGMDMGDMAMDGSIRLTPAQASTFGITFGMAEVRPLVRTIRAVGVVEFDETRMAYVAPKFGGWAERLYVDFTGRIVRAGQPLLDVYSPELVTAQEELLLAARMAESAGTSRFAEVAEGARDLLESARRRLAYWDITDEQISRLLETGEVSRTLTLHAPVSGVVMEKDVFQGQAFQSGRNLYMIADLSEVWVSVEIFETDVPLVREGMPAEISVASLPGETLTGTIEYVYPTLEDRTRSMRARVAVPNPGARLKPGMYATAVLRAALGETLTVPSSAVLRTGERAVAFVDMGGGELMPHELRLGARGEGYVQVLEGLEPGHRVVTSAQFLLDSESNLAEVMQAMMAQMGMSDMGGMDMEGMDGMGGMDGMEMAPRPDSAGGR